MTGRRHRRMLAASVVVLLALSGPEAHGDSPSVAVTSVEGRAVADDSLDRPVRDGVLDLTGSTTGAPVVIVDAGDSAYVRAGELVLLDGLHAYGTGPHEVSWTFAGASDRFSEPTSTTTRFDTTGLGAGRHLVELTVTDAEGNRGHDDVVVEVYDEALVAESQEVLVGVNDEDLDASGAVDGETYRYPFRVSEGSGALTAALDWEFELNDFDLRLEGPGGQLADDTSGSSLNKPESLGTLTPTPGDWVAVVQSYLAVDDTFKLSVAVTRPDPRPTIDLGGPLRFEDGAAQRLTATTSGGTAPLEVRWDLDGDAVADAVGDEVVIDLPVGSHLVTAKVTDGSGLERRQTTAVRVVEPGSTGGTSPIVVVGVSDTGINLYHRDFAASTYPDPRVLELTGGFTRHPSEYIPGYPATARALAITLGEGYLPEQDRALFTREALPLNTLFWVPGTKVVGAVDTSDVAPVNGDPDLLPVLDEDGHGTASASVAVGNIYGYCPSCLLVFGEGLASDEFMYEQPWVDIASNSFGSPGNVGFAGTLAPPAQPKENAEAGQLALYAAGNGNENAFVTPQQTYTSENLGADWLVRVGAVDAGSRKPIVGTGKPVDISSFGFGNIPAAGIATETGETRHSGTSAATPITAGVFGAVLGGARDALGDSHVGQRGYDGVVAAGTPLASSPFLRDGALTRAELVEAVFKTAEHDDGPGGLDGYPLTTPSNEHQYLFEGYGIADRASAARALAVLRGGAPLPERPAEDEFFAADSELRDALWGGWSGGGEGGTPPPPPEETSGNPFAGTTRERVATWPAAWSLLQAVAGPFRAAASQSASSQGDGGLGISITTPVAGETVAPNRKLPVAGTVSLLPDDGAVAAVPYFLRRDACGTADDGLRLTLEDGPDEGNGCSLAAQAVGPTGIAEFVETYPVVLDDLPHALTTAASVNGTIFVDGNAVSPDHTITVLLTGAVDGMPVEIGQATVTGTVVDVTRTVEGQKVSIADPVPFDFEFPVAPEVAGRALDSLELKVRIDQSRGATYHSLEAPHASVVRLPVARVPEGTIVEVAVDDTGFAAAVPADVSPDGTWSAEIDSADLGPGQHVLHARVVQAGRSATADQPFVRRRSVTATVVEAQVVPRGGPAATDGWVEAASAADLTSWRAAIGLAGLPDGRYEILTRVRLGVDVLAEGRAVTFTLDRVRSTRRR